mmetsp:Transcript_29608/g.61789  ORF Transcript_29608/g.61789 Transcript_29608/m.61789 type:complete len:228 (+) Transcript_29608:1525-2208(+)
MVEILLCTNIKPMAGEGGRIQRHGAGIESEGAFFSRGHQGTISQAMAPCADMHCSVFIFSSIAVCIVSLSASPLQKKRDSMRLSISHSIGRVYSKRRSPKKSDCMFFTPGRGRKNHGGEPGKRHMDIGGIYRKTHGRALKKRSFSIGRMFATTGRARTAIVFNRLGVSTRCGAWKNRSFSWGVGGRTTAESEKRSFSIGRVFSKRPSLKSIVSIGVEKRPSPKSDCF